MNISSKVFYFFYVFGLLFCSCGKQYFYLNKVRANPNKGTFNLQIDNYAPKQIYPAFEAEIKDAAIKKLIRLGHAYKPNNPQYVISLSVMVDSVESVGTAYVGGMFVGRSIATGAYRNYSVNSRGIYLKASAEFLRTKANVWKMEYDLYYFAQPYRDIRRTRGVVRYMMGKFKHK